MPILKYIFLNAYERYKHARQPSNHILFETLEIICKSATTMFGCQIQIKRKLTFGNRHEPSDTKEG